MRPHQRLVMAARLAKYSTKRSKLLQRVLQALEHWSRQRSYTGADWYGIEQFHLHLAKVVESVGIEVAGWYRYPSSSREDMDGKDWRLVLPDEEGAVVVNCHSLLHDGVWSLSTSIYHTYDVDLMKLQAIGAPHHWLRTLLWTRMVAEELQTHGYDYAAVIEDIDQRMAWTSQLQVQADGLIPMITEEFTKLTGEVPILPEAHVGLSSIGIYGSKVGMHDPPDPLQPYSVITIHPKALKTHGYVEIVLLHELCHYVLQVKDTDPHGELFQQLASAVGIPDKFQD